jgi:hypothetical protein
VLAAIAAAAGRDCGHRIAIKNDRPHRARPLRTSRNIVARKPRFAHDAVKAAPHSDG